MFSGCGGSRAKYKFSKSVHPISMSSSLLDENGKNVSEKNGLTVISSFEFTRREWTIFWTLIPLTRSSWIDKKINEEVQQKNGKGVINLEMHSDLCAFNVFPLFSVLPIMPGCIKTTFNGDIVR